MAVSHHVLLLLLCAGNELGTFVPRNYVRRHPVALIATDDIDMLFAALLFHDTAAYPTGSDTLGCHHGNGRHFVWIPERERHHLIQVICPFTVTYGRMVRVGLVVSSKGSQLSPANEVKN